MNGTLVGTGSFTQSATQSTYKVFEAPIQYDAIFTGVPDSATIFIAPTTDVNNATGTSYIWVDNLQLNKFALGIAKNKPSTVQAYPNPFHDQLTLNTHSDKAEAVLTAMDGRVVLSDSLTGTTNVISTGDLAKGMYILRIQDGDELHTLKLVRE